MFGHYYHRLMCVCLRAFQLMVGYLLTPCHAKKSTSAYSAFPHSPPTAQHLSAHALHVEVYFGNNTPRGHTLSCPPIHNDTSCIDTHMHTCMHLRTVAALASQPRLVMLMEVGYLEALPPPIRTTPITVHPPGALTMHHRKLRMTARTARRWVA
jgi:hypothetical protein